MNKELLKRYITNKELIDWIETVVTIERVYVINKDLYKTTNFKDRVYLNADDCPNLENYHEVNIEHNFRELRNRKNGRTTLEKHSEDVMIETAKLLESDERLYEGLDTIEYETMAERDMVKHEFRDICLAGAYLHDIGKAVIGVDDVQIDDHSYVGGNYIYRFMQSLYSIYEDFEYKYVLGEKLDNIVRWHMGYVIDHETEQYIAERRPDSVKHLETYLVSIADWIVNTRAGTKRYKVIMNDWDNFMEDIKSGEYKIRGTKDTIYLVKEDRRLKMM